MAKGNGLDLGSLHGLLVEGGRIERHLDLPPHARG